ncbi:hypothetical protein ACIQAL_22320 [Pseudomonas sp. NPDC088368]|uniref:hypothetical protein n=1 Tax=Pseudomonas sp. NPDC088368 TaxID=3364453 RepID=UPI003823F6EF
MKTKLTRTASVLANLSDKHDALGQVLADEERSLLQKSIKVIQAVSQKIETAKECRLQDEKALEQRFHERQAEGWALAQHFFPVQHENSMQREAGLCIALSLNQLGLLKPEKQPAAFDEHLRTLAEGLSANFGAEYFFHELFSDCQQSIQQFITAHSSSPVESNLAELKQLIDELSPKLRARVMTFGEYLVCVPPTSFTGSRDE